VGAVAIDASKELMLISDGGTLVRTRASEVAQTGRNAQGVRLIRLGENETLVGVEAIEAVEEDEILEEISAIDAEQLVDDSTIMDQIETESDDLNEPEED
jgi:DNA gyrase subunit A